jgi:hypothetical protein
MASFKRIAPLLVAMTALAVASSGTVLADPGDLPYGPDTCIQGFVWREAFDGDTICVTPGERADTKADNAAAASRRQVNAPKPADPYTPKPTPTAGHNVVLEITGAGTVYSIDIDPGGRVATENSAAPFRTSITAGSGELVQIVAVTKTGDQGCRITVDGTVVVSQGAGDAHCIYTLP